MRFAALVFPVLTAAVLHAQGLRATDDLNRRGDGVNHLELWVESVQTHRGGVPDEATRRIAGWTTLELDELLIDLPSLIKLMDDPRGDVFSVWIERGRNAGRRRVVYSGSELDRLRRLARAAGGRDPVKAIAPNDEARIVAAQNRLLKRGAALHTTIALNRQDQTDARPANPFITNWEGVIQFNDGRQTGLDGRANHWRFARTLLDLVTPSPSRDSDVRDWYRASSAVLLRNLLLYVDHFDQALRLFPDDPLLLMFGGSFHEALASSGVQSFVRSATLPRGVVLRVGSPRTELGRAEPLLQRALKIDPRAAEARVRLGRVLSLQARHADALSELRRLDSSAPSILQYYGNLFAGDAAEALGRVDEARAAYERAAKLYPLAQAPRLALSHLAESAGNRANAIQVIEPVLTAQREPAPEDDPFWTYFTAAGRDAGALLATAYRTLSEEAAP
jgi:tetratricopeptide (TPR) repeat protein